jgi:hypothetical protein
MPTTFFLLIMSALLFVLVGLAIFGWFYYLTQESNTDRSSFQACLDFVSYLGRHPSAMPVLYVAGEHVKRIFGNKAELTAKLTEDPSTGYRQVFLVIETKLPVDEADHLLTRLEDEWWLSAMPSDGSVALELKHI